MVLLNYIFIFKKWIKLKNIAVTRQTDVNKELYNASGNINSL